MNAAARKPGLARNTASVVAARLADIAGSAVLLVVAARYFGVAEFGSGTFVVDSLPVWVAGAAPGPLLSDLADGLMQGGKSNAQNWAQPVIAEIAGRQAIGLQRELTEPELHALIRDLARTEMPYTSPRGKPTVILLSYRELNRKFGRD